MIDILYLGEQISLVAFHLEKEGRREKRQKFHVPQGGRKSDAGLWALCHRAEEKERNFDIESSYHRQSAFGQCGEKNSGSDQKIFAFPGKKWRGPQKEKPKRGMKTADAETSTVFSEYRRRQIPLFCCEQR